MLRRRFWAGLLAVLGLGSIGSAAGGKLPVIRPVKQGRWRVLRVPLRESKQYDPCYIDEVCRKVRELMTMPKPGCATIVTWGWVKGTSQKKISIERVWANQNHIEDVEIPD